MPTLQLTVLSLRYSSWSMRAWLVLTRAGASFETTTVELESFAGTTLAERRSLGSVSGLFPVLRIDGTPIHESLAIAETAAELFPAAGLWPERLLERARARAVVAEMVSGFPRMRAAMSCHLFARAPGFRPDDATRADIERVFEIWSECLERSGGPFLFGSITMADDFYYPVLTRFRTYGIELPGTLEPYAQNLETDSVVTALVAKARTEPAIAVYDDFVRSLGGSPLATI